MIFTVEDYFSRMKERPSEEVIANANILINRVNDLLAECPPDVLPDGINSGWRSEKYNAKVPNAAVRSKHITGQAIDLGDPDGALDDFLMKNLALLEKYQLWMEHPSKTPKWTHLQSIPSKSRNRVFFP